MNLLYLNDSFLDRAVKAQGWQNYSMDSIVLPIQAAPNPFYEGTGSSTMRVYDWYETVGANSILIVTGIHLSSLLNKDEFAIHGNVLFKPDSNTSQRLFNDFHFSKVTSDGVNGLRDWYHAYEPVQYMVKNNVHIQYKILDTNPPYWTNAALTNFFFCKVYGYRISKLS